MQDYHFAADLLNKFSQLTPWVQAVIGISFAAMITGIAHFIKETLAVAVRPLCRDSTATETSEKK